MSLVRTRFAPSPTGYLHVGGVRTALYCWAFARQQGGQFVLRIEDTDLERSKPEHSRVIVEAMAWLGLEHDNQQLAAQWGGEFSGYDPDTGCFHQSRRTERYRHSLEQLLAQGDAYHCHCTPQMLEAMRQQAIAQGQTPRYDGRCRELKLQAQPGLSTIRLKTPSSGEVRWVDVIKGAIVVANHTLDDFILARSDGSPTYNFCVAVDDADMGISHVIRGDDHVLNTPRQIHVLRALGHKLPLYGHVPMILGDDGTRLSKRHGAVSVLHYREAGYVPEAMLNYLARLGWSHQDDEIFSRDQLVQWFGFEACSSAAARFDFAKLAWTNASHLRQLPLEQALAWLAQHHRTLAADTLPAAVALLLGRVNTLAELAGQLPHWLDTPPPVSALGAEVLAAIAQLRLELQQLPQWEVEAIAALLKTVAQQQQLKFAQLAVPLRRLLLGQEHSASVDQVICALGRQRVDQRLARAGAL